MRSRGRAGWVSISTAVVVTLALAAGWTNTLDLPARDAALRLLPARRATASVVVAIDEASLAAIGPWPWSRDDLARIVDGVRGAGARAVMIDLLLAEPLLGDDRLAAALRQLPSFAVAGFDDAGRWLLPAPSLRGSVTPVHGIFELDGDGIRRRLATTKQDGQTALVAMSVAAASVVTRAPVEVGGTVLPAFRTPPRAVPQVSAADLLRHGGAAAAFRGKLVFLGPTALGLGDRTLTPVSAVPDPGVTIHAAAAESLVRGETVRPIAPLADGVLAGLAVFSIVYRRRPAVRRVVAVAAAGAAVFGGGVLLLAWTGLAVPFATMAIVIGGAALSMEGVRMTSALREGKAAAQRMEQQLGIPPRATEEDVAPRIEQIATRLAERQAREAESKRVLAHELRTPLASMRGLTQLLAGFDLSDGERRRVASLLESEAGKLQAMVGALLDLERLPLRDYAASTEVIDAGELVARRVEFLRAGSDRPIEASVGRGLLVRADAALIERVVDNLVGNALKYAPPPSPVTVRVRPSGSSVVLEVADRGPGIPEVERARVFSRFFRGTTAAGTEGLGLGLALVGEVAQWHGGLASVDAAEGGGALFRFALPMAATAVKAGSI